MRAPYLGKRPRRIVYRVVWRQRVRQGGTATKNPRTQIDADDKRHSLLGGPQPQVGPPIDVSDVTDGFAKRGYRVVSLAARKGVGSDTLNTETPADDRRNGGSRPTQRVEDASR